MKYRAVIFDLFGTLIDSLSAREHERVVSDMATVLSAPDDSFARLWIQMYDERAVGVLTTRTCIERICSILGLRPQDGQVALAARQRLDLIRRALTPRPGATETIAQLKALGYKTGLISDCPEEVAILWQDTPLAPLIDVPIFSCSVGLKKPDPRIYLLACERLGVLPEQCIYIGDGGSRELSGASQVGMRAMRIRVPEMHELDAHRVDAEEWEGETICSLPDLLALV